MILAETATKGARKVQIEIGQIVQYRLSMQDVEGIQKQRKVFKSLDMEPLAKGNDVSKGEIYPAIVTRAHSAEQASLHIILDGPDTFWVTSSPQGQGEGQWQEVFMGASQSASQQQRQGQTATR